MARVLVRALAVLFQVGCGSEAAPSGPPVARPEPGRPVRPTADEGVPPLDPSDPLDAEMLRRVALFAPNMIAATPMQRGRLSTGESQDFQAVLQAGHCFRIVAVGGQGVTDLDLFLFDPAGVQVQQDTAVDAYPVLGLNAPICPERAGAYRVQVRMFAGAGEFGVQVYRTPG
ncbi:MAG: hypothetical protein NZ898_02565 [Myxococcota bacterium]|nr:hypothetical protein [Myxococcota bacterium]MDW8361255.1 hypothetical protein [Myxococcales bacterium]